MSKAEVWMQEIAQKAAEAVTGRDGRFKDPDFFAEIERLLAEEERPDVIREVKLNAARRIGNRFLRARSPRKKKDDPIDALFDPGYILPLGDETRVFMDRATPDDLIMYGALSSEMAANVNRAAADRQDYVASRLKAFRSSKGQLLGGIERDVFGYVEPDEPEEYDDPDDDQ